jgi:hypothetical protein
MGAKTKKNRRSTQIYADRGRHTWSVAGVHGDAGVLGDCGDGRDSVMMVAIETAIGMAGMAAERMALRMVAVVLLD